VNLKVSLALNPRSKLCTTEQLPEYSK
jgi:hypothetical protein